MEQLIEFIGNHPILSSVWVVLLVWLVFSFVNSTFSPVKDLNTHEATLLMNKEEAVVVDIRPTNEFSKGHILGAKHLKPEQVNKPDFSSLEKHKNKPMIVVCAMGMNSRKTATQLLKAGFNKAFILKGGMNAWQTQGLPIKK